MPNLFPHPNKDLWRQASKRLCLEFDISYRQLYDIIQVMYGFCNVKDYDRYLNLPIQELKKGIRRLKPYLKDWNRFKIKRKLYPEQEEVSRSPFCEHLDSLKHDSYPCKRGDGVWRQIEPIEEIISNFKEIEEDE